MGFYYTNFYYRNVTDPIEWYSDKDFSTKSSGNAVTFRNADSGTDYGIEFFFMLMGQTFGGGYNINELYDATGDFQLNGKNERMNMYMRINLPKEYIKFFSYEFGFYYMKMKQKKWRRIFDYMTRAHVSEFEGFRFQDAFDYATDRRGGDVTFTHVDKL